ncbi:unnamed protein product, partial [Trichogramma brassicae]
ASGATPTHLSVCTRRRAATTSTSTAAAVICGSASDISFDDGSSDLRRLHMLIDTGAEVSVIPKEAVPSAELSSFKLFNADSTPIDTYGSHSLERLGEAFDELRSDVYVAEAQAEDDVVFQGLELELSQVRMFSARWKRQRLVLMLKPSKPAFEPSSYRPLCMLDTAGKLLERIIADRLEAFTEGPAGLADSQFGFRKGRSTIDAIQKVLSTAKAAISG